jgi:hypothetical protein
MWFPNVGESKGFKGFYLKNSCNDIKTYLNMRIHALKVFHMPTLLAWNGIF